MQLVNSYTTSDPARFHRPTDRETLRAVAVELVQRGLTAADVARSLDLTEGAVRDLLRGQYP